MPSYRIGELRSLRSYQLELLEKVDFFIKDTNRFVQGNSELSIDIDKNQKTIAALDFILSGLRDYRRDVIKWSRGIKPRSRAEREDPRFRGYNDNMRGDRDKIIRRLNKLEERILWIRGQVDSFTPSGESYVLNRTIKLVEESITMDQGQAKLAPGGEITILIAMLFTAFYQFKLNRSKSKED